MNNKSQVVTINLTASAGGSAVSDPILLGNDNLNGVFALESTITGNGTGTIEYELSIRGNDYLTPSGASDIATAVTKTSGPNSDGKDYFSFNPNLSTYLKIKLTETGSADSITLSGALMRQ